MTVETEHEKRLAKLGAAIRAIRKELPGTKSFPEKLKREGAALLSVGISAGKIASACGLVDNTITKWGVRYSTRCQVEAPRTLRVVPDRATLNSSKSERHCSMCEIDLGFSVVVRIPIENLTQDFLRNLRGAFQSC